MKRYTETAMIYEGMAKSFFFIEGGIYEELDDFIKSNRRAITRSLSMRGVDVRRFEIIPHALSNPNSIEKLVLRRQPTLDKETLAIKAEELRSAFKIYSRSKLLFINSCGYDAMGEFKADIICEDYFGDSIEEVAEKIERFIEYIIACNNEKEKLCDIRYRLHDDEEEDDELRFEDNKECLFNDLLAESLCSSEENRISPIFFDDKFNMSLPLYPQIDIVLEPLPKTLYILFLQHPEGIILKDICMYEDELKRIYRNVSGRRNPTVINRMFRSLTDPTGSPLHKNLSIIRRCFTSKLNYKIARNYIPAHGRKKAHCIPLESEYVILPGIV